jgi:membrane dipeptidase
VHHASFVMDFHNDVLEKVVTGYQLGVRNTINHSDLPRFRDGGVDAQMMSVWVNPTAYPSTAFQRAMQMIDSFEVQVARNPTTLAPARTEAEVLQANREGKFAAMLSIEGGHAIQDDLTKLRALHARGARSMTITWNNSTAWATSAADAQSATRGLSPFGVEVIRLMDSLGMIIDVAHTGIKTIQDILATTRNPVVDTHAGARALRNHYRNLTDSQIVAVARTGGVIGVVFYPPFLTGAGTASIDTVIRHIEYIRTLAGIDHVALGSDFDGIEQTVTGLENVTRFPSLSRALLRRGWTVADLQKLHGGNMLRVIRTVCRP